MMRTPRTDQVFHAGEKVIITSTIHRRLHGKRGVISNVSENAYAHTLDRYTVQIEDPSEEAVLWDIELRRAE